MNRLLRPGIGPKKYFKSYQEKSCGFKEAKKWEN
jgi:hypothetical protein